MKAKKILLTSIIATQVLTASALAAPDEAIKEFNKVAPIKQEVKHFQGEVKLFIIKDGEKVRVDQKMPDGLRVVNGRTCVGVRDLVNAIEGAKVEWDGTNHIVDITYGGKTISYPVGKPLMWADGKAVTVDVPAQIDPAISKTFLPIRNIAETSGFKVDWDNKAKEVVLTPGAGTGVTTAAAQQPRPTTQTPTQNKNLAWVTASGQRIPKPEELPTAKYKQDDTIELSSTYEIKAKPEDIEQNLDGSITYFKGTILEYTSDAPFKKVDSIAKRPSNWSIFKENKNDPRVGTALVTKGQSEYDNAYNNSINNLLSGKADKDFFFSIVSFLKYFKGNNVTEISKDELKRQAKDYNKSKSGESGKKLANSIFNSRAKVFDVTGVIDASKSGIYKRSSEYPRIIWSTEPTYYITTDGGIISAIFDVDDYIKKHGNFIIDKVIFTDFAYYIADIPNVDYKNYINKNKKYNSNYFSIGDFDNTNIAK